MKRVVTVTLTCTYEFDEKEYPKNKYDDDTICDIAYDWWYECNPDIYLETEEENEG